MILRILYILLPLLGISQAVTPDCFAVAKNEGRLICDNVDLRGVDSTAFGTIDSLRKRITTVELKECQIDNLDFLDSEFLVYVQILKIEKLTGLTDNHLSAIVPRMSETLTSLTITDQLLLTSVDRLIPTGASSGNEWSKLDTLRVNRNGLTSVDPQLFRKINNAKEYDFRDNKLTSIDFNMHNNVGKTRDIYLSGNSLTTITGLEGFEELEHLQIANNDLTSVDNFISAILRSNKIENIDLSNNKIESFSPNGDGTRTGSPLTIDLQNNRLTTVTNLGLSLAARLQSLNLGENSELLITADIFKDLSALKELRLASCGITQITTELQYLPDLQVVELQNNNINQISADAFRGTLAIEEIYLHGNKLEELDFMTTPAFTLEKLETLDVSLNILDNLKNFVSAPKLVKLKMDGNKLGQLSTCESFTTLPTTLKIVCARNIPVGTVNKCQYRTFTDLISTHETQIIFNNDDCCDKATCNESTSISVYPSAKECGDKQTVCESVIIPDLPPTKSPTPGGEGTTKSICQPMEREAFQHLHDSEKIVMAIGYILALVFLVMVIILFLRRYRSYDKWLDDHHERNNMEVSSLPQHMATRKSTEMLDMVDGRRGVGSPKLSPKLGANGTLQRQCAQTSKSFDNLSMASGMSNYSTATGKSPFMGRKKFKDANSIDMETQSIRYVSPATRARLESGDESPTAMSVYSYASHQPERWQHAESSSPPSERRRHRSGGAVQRLKSTELLEQLMQVDEDIMPPKVQVVLQRKATEKKNQGGSGYPLARNSRAYGSAPYRNKGKGIAKKKAISPLLAAHRIHRKSGTPSINSMNKRALPDLPLDSLGSFSSMKSGSSMVSENSKLSDASLIKRNSVFDKDGEVEDSLYSVTDHDGVDHGFLQP